MENIKQTINLYIRSIKRNYSAPYSKNDVDSFHKKMKEVYLLAGKDFASFENAFKNKKINDESYMFNYSAVSFEGMLNNFFMSSVTKWIDSNYEFFDKSYLERSDTRYCIEGPLPKDKFIKLFEEVGVRDSNILLSIYELKEPLTMRFNYEEEKRMRRAARYTRVVFPKPNSGEFPWSKVKYWFFNNIINKKLLSKIPILG